uniref:Uncharacterized protein n=1 Tax=Desertifilum tharense IPPAS B-1220 TaxID=1781255 RepID=A0ACD5GUX4_9CYAN
MGVGGWGRGELGVGSWGLGKRGIRSWELGVGVRRRIGKESKSIVLHISSALLNPLSTLLRRS